LLGLLVLGVACNKPAEKKETTTTSASATASATAEAPTAKPSAAPSASAAAKTVDLEVNAKATKMAFDETALSVPAGSTVHLTFTNHKPGALPHNWALVKPGTEAKVAAAGLKKGEKAGYIDESDEDLLAHTPLVKPGDKGEVTFKAPAAGKYPYICTYPGHYVMMKGVLTVQ